MNLELNLLEMYAERYSRYTQKERKKEEKTDWQLVEAINVEILKNEQLINDGLAWIKKYQQHSCVITFWVHVGEGKKEEAFKVNVWMLDSSEVDPETKADWFIEVLSDGDYPFAEGTFKASDES